MRYDLRTRVNADLRPISFFKAVDQMWKRNFHTKYMNDFSWVQ